MATVAEKLQLTLNSKNSIKQALEKNNVSTDGKVFSEYGDLVDKAINSEWPEILYSFSSGINNHWVRLELPYDFKVRLEAPEYLFVNDMVSYRIGDSGDWMKDAEVHLGKANDNIFITCTGGGNGGYLHITRA